MTTRTDAATLQQTYDETQTAVFQALDALKLQVLNHGVPAAGGHYHWGYIGDMQAILHHLQHLPISMTPR